MKSMLMLLALVGTATAQVTFSRTVSDVASGLSGTVTVDPSDACTSSDEYGSNDCTLNWGTNYTITHDVTVPTAIDNTYKLNVDITVDGLLPLSFSCPACGANCTFTIPVISQSVTIPALPCPLVAAGGSVGKNVFPLPASSPVPLGASFSGTVSIVDGTGATTALVTVTGSESP